jgi:hypothetical protein
MYVDQNGQKQQTVNNEGVGQTTQSLTWLTTKEIQESGVDPSALHYLGRHTATGTQVHGQVSRRHLPAWIPAAMAVLC